MSREDRIKAGLREGRAADGDLEIRMGEHSADELGDISNRFDRFMGNLGGLVSGARRNLADLSRVGGELADHMARNQEKTGEINRRITESKSGTAERAGESTAIVGELVSAAETGKGLQADV